MRYFQLSEFDSPDAPGSGAKMDKEFLALLDEARHLAGVPFKVNSGYRTQAHHNSLAKKGFKTAKNSAHLRGFAADIHAPDSRTRYAILQALIKVGFNRIGVANTFIHVDNDPSLPEEVIWTY
jgi:zinc D-Ala-D-Ala carboxypeptidase